jgi:hypothetical protein
VPNLTGIDSPVMSDSSQTLSPATTLPSTGILDPKNKSFLGAEDLCFFVRKLTFFQIKAKEHKLCRKKTESSPRWALLP